MTDHADSQYALFSDLPALSEDEIDDARFRAKDLAWSVLARAFDEGADNDKTLTYHALGQRINRSRSQVQRWFDAPHNLTMQSLSLLAEGLDAELAIRITRRKLPLPTNGCHPADDARANSGFRLFNARKDDKTVNASGKVRGWGV